MSRCDKEVQRRAAWFDPTVIVATVVSTGPAKVVTATVHPFNLYSGDAEVTASVSWEGTSVVASLVQGEANAQPWFRCIQAVWAAMSPDTAPVQDEFSPQRWTRATLWLPDVDGEREAKIIVELRRKMWKAEVDWPGNKRQGVSSSIPVELRHLDAGSLLVELTARLAFGRRWL